MLPRILFTPSFAEIFPKAAKSTLMDGMVTWGWKLMGIYIILMFRELLKMLEKYFHGFIE